MKLSELCEFIVDSEHKTAPTQETGYPMIRTPNLGRGTFILDGVRRVSSETYEAWTRRGKPRYGDLILAREAPVGNVAMVPEGLKPCLGQRTVLIRPKHEEVDAKYLAFLIVGDEIQGRIHGMSSGATVAHLNMKDIRNLELPPLPTLPTQRKIASILSAYDDLIENNTRRIAILEEMAQAIYREWFVNFRFPGHENVKLVDSPLGQIPEGWEIKPLADCCKLVMGQSPKSEFYNGSGEGLPFHQGVTNFGPRYPTHKTFCTVENRLADEGDILFSVRAPVGRINIANTEIIVGRGVSAIRRNDDAQVFLFHQLKDKFKEEDIMGGGTIFKSVTKKDLATLPLLNPPKDVLAAFESMVGASFTLYDNLTKKNDILRTTRDLLLPKLISGKLDVEDLDIDVGEPIDSLEEATA